MTRTRRVGFSKKRRRGGRKTKRRRGGRRRTHRSRVSRRGGKRRSRVKRRGGRRRRRGGDITRKACIQANEDKAAAKQKCMNKIPICPMSSVKTHSGDECSDKQDKYTANCNSNSKYTTTKCPPCPFGTVDNGSGGCVKSRV